MMIIVYGKLFIVKNLRDIINIYDLLLILGFSKRNSYIKINY